MPFKTDEDTGEIVIVTKSKFQPKFVDSTGQLISANNVPQSTAAPHSNSLERFTSHRRWQDRCLTPAGWCADHRTVEGSAVGIAFEAEDGGFVMMNDNAANDNPMPAEGGEQFTISKRRRRSAIARGYRSGLVMPFRARLKMPV